MLAESTPRRPPAGATDSAAVGTGSRYAALEAAAARIRVRRGVPVPVEQILLIAAAILFPLGLIFILLGWDGAAHNGHTYAQIDYLISGGMFGLGLSVAGGFMYFGYWLSRQLGESRRQSALVQQAMQRLEDLLDAALTQGPVPAARPEDVAYRPNGTDHVAPPAAGPGPGGAATVVTADAAAVGANGRRGRKSATSGATMMTAGVDDATGEVPAMAGPMLMATPRGTLLHRPQCPVVARRGDLRPVPAGSSGYGFCTMCDAAGVLA
jgi:hypothetical protein